MRSKRYLAGLGLLIGGLVATPIFLGLAIGSTCTNGAFGSCEPPGSCPCPAYQTTTGFFIGAILATASELSFLAVGPGLMGSGAQQAAGEVPTMPGVQLKF
jgi:hypothetical protein